MLFCGIDQSSPHHELVDNGNDNDSGGGLAQLFDSVPYGHQS